MVTADQLPHTVPAFREATLGALASVLDQSLDCIKIIGLDGTLEFMNANGQLAMEIDDFSVVAGCPWASLWPQAARGDLDAALDLARSGAGARFEAFCPTPKGTPRWWDVSVSPVRDDDGLIVSVISVSRDVTRQVNEAQAQTALTEEIRHRLMNCYTMASALTRGFARGDVELEQFARDMGERLSSLAVAQTLMAVRGGAPCGLAELVAAVMTPFGTATCPVTVGVFGEGLLDQGQADAIALVLGELSVNSFKHGALSSTGSVSVLHAPGHGPLSLLWSERSDRAVAEHERHGGKGLALMSRIMAARRGTLEVTWFDDGLDVLARFGEA